MFTLFPAVDIQDGKAVRLEEGKRGTETQYGNPIESALLWQNQGAKWLHLVDLDAAFGTGDNYQIICEVIRALDINVELSGGIRDEDGLKRALATGCARVNIGTAALENRDWCKKAIEIHKEKIGISLDVLLVQDEWRLRSRGWVKDGGNLWEVLDDLNQANCSCYVVTDVSRDGSLKGPNIDLIKEVAQRTDAQVIASGGVSSLADIKTLAELNHQNIGGVIVGKALYELKFTLADALTVVSGMGE